MEMYTWVFVMSRSPHRQGQGNQRFNEGHLLNGLIKSYSICLGFHHHNSKGYLKDIVGNNRYCRNDIPTKGIVGMIHTGILGLVSI